MERISEVRYETPGDGTLTVRHDGGEWVVDDNGTVHRFSSVPEWMDYVADTHSWPLPVRGTS